MMRQPLVVSAKVSPLNINTHFALQVYEFKTHRVLSSNGSPVQIRWKVLMCAKCRKVGGWRGGREGVHKYSEGDSEVMWLMVIIFIIANIISLCDDVHGGGA